MSLLISPQVPGRPGTPDNMDLADYLELQKRFQQVTGLGKSSKRPDMAGRGLLAEVV